MGSGCAHSKIMVLIYPDFLRVVITSANLYVNAPFSRGEILSSNQNADGCRRR
jgi:hypothetical protein